MCAGDEEVRRRKDKSSVGELAGVVGARCVKRPAMYTAAIRLVSPDRPRPPLVPLLPILNSFARPAQPAAVTSACSAP